MFKILSVGALALALAACGTLKAPRANPKSSGGTVPAPGLPVSGRTYRVDESQSELRILVYRAGPLAHLGHNHVMVNRAVHGSGNLADAPGASEFSLSIPAAGFVVDDAQARSEEGADFASQVPEDAKAGTLRNMLSTGVLDADEFPNITVNSRSVDRAPGGSGAGAPSAATSGGGAKDAATLIASVSINVAGHESTIDVPFTLQNDSNRLTATGSLELRQTALGLTPYSLMLGALQVQDMMTIKFKIVAVPSLSD